ncbi:hypothetical protein ACI797_21260 [Geodermatophilus sp. SYSU D00691]
MQRLRTYARLFVACGVPFGIVTGLLSLPFLDAGGGVAAGASAGVLFGGGMALLLGTTDAVADRGARPGAPHGPRQSATLAVHPSPDLPQRVVDALAALPATVATADPVTGRFTATTRTTWKSWGEEVTVQLSGDPAAPTATVSSRPRVRTSLVDYGRGRSNVAAVVAALRAPADAWGGPGRGTVGG